ncbi:MAG: protein-glutamate O-methyltransferase CheR [Clostridia bacterium]|jgi:chemotaxis protein methyltransferase CheR
MDYTNFKNKIDKLTGINLDSYKERQMKRRIESLIRKNNYQNFDDYFRALHDDEFLYKEFINYLTINVSEFYRSSEQFKVLENEIIPLILKTTKYPRIWSAACSTGEEPYTLAMILNKFIPLKNIKIIASDIDNGSIEKAILGVYSKKSIGKLPKEYIGKHFIVNNEEYSLSNEIKRCVEFKQLDLLKDDYPVKCDLIVCRNVLIYFTEKAKSEIYMKFNDSMNDTGILFVGSTEQILRSGKYKLKQFKMFFYKKEES